MTMTQEQVKALVARLVGKTWYVTDSTGQRWADDAPEDAARTLLATLDELDAVKAERDNNAKKIERLLVLARHDQHKISAEQEMAVAADARAEAANAALTAREGVIAYALQDERNTGDCPRVVDIAYNAFMIAKHPNKEDGGPSDWFTDTRPMVMEKIAEIRAALQHKDDTHGPE